MEVPLAEIRATRTGTHDAWEEEKRLTASIDRIQQTLDAKAGKPDKREMYGWERAKAAYERHGDYKKVQAGLRALKIAYPDMYTAVRRVWFSDIPTARDFAVEDLGVSWMAEIIRGPIRVPPWVMERQAQRKRDTVESLHEQGLGAGAIARRLCIDKRKVRKMLARRKSGGG